MPCHGARLPKAMLLGCGAGVGSIAHLICKALFGPQRLRIRITVAVPDQDQDHCPVAVPSLATILRSGTNRMEYDRLSRAEAALLSKYKQLRKQQVGTARCPISARCPASAPAPGSAELSIIQHTCCTALRCPLRLPVHSSPAARCNSPYTPWRRACRASNTRGATRARSCPTTRTTCSRTARRGRPSASPRSR